METQKIRPLICYAGSAGRNLCKFLTLGKEPITFFFLINNCQNKNKIYKKSNEIFNFSKKIVNKIIKSRIFNELLSYDDFIEVKLCRVFIRRI